jgi:N-acetyl-alpha-D-muramate 1-phosphate uridylyltransferase
MNINTALILCAGFGKRLNPITLKTPKPLLKLKNSTPLENCINLNINLGIKKILINTYYLKEHFHNYFKKHNYKIDIQIIDDGEKILDTGGGILNMINNSNEENFLIFNPDTLWENRYIEEIKSMINFYFSQKSKNMLMLVNKDLSFDKNLNGDFNLENNLINNQTNKEYIYMGCQIINRNVFKGEISNIFSISKIWKDLIQSNKLNGFESKLDFYHLTDLEIFKKLKDL